MKKNLKTEVYVIATLRSAQTFLFITNPFAGARIWERKVGFSNEKPELRVARCHLQQFLPFLS